MYKQCLLQKKVLSLLFEQDIFKYNIKGWDFEIKSM